LFLRKKSKLSNRKIIASQDLSKRLASRILREATWLLLLFIGLYIILAIASYSSSDPSWIHSSFSLAEKMCLFSELAHAHMHGPGGVGGRRGFLYIQYSIQSACIYCTVQYLYS
jgi:hypothetical protein